MATLAEQWIEEGKREGLQQGWQQGLQQGMQQGLQQGLQQGWQQGLQQGMQQEAREMVYEAVSSRFGVIPEDIARGINAIADRVVLRTLLRQAITCRDLEAFGQMLNR